MALFENFPYTNLHELNLDWLINEINEVKEGQVLSVNGQTGDVILYQDNDILFPAVTDSHWSMVRSADGTTRGIMFGNDNKAYIVHGSTMEQIYSASNQPPYPVESVNGKTGAVSLFTDNNGVVSFPAVTDPGIEGIIIGRTLNNKPVYIQINDDGTAGVTAGVNSNEIYTTANTDKNVFPVPEAGTTETGTNNKQWGVVREVNSGDIGLLFNLGETPEVYLRYRDTGLNWQNVKLLTNDDIPSSSGVVSFNGQTGVVTATGADLDVSTSDTRSIDDALDALSLIDNRIKQSITYTENTDTADTNIPIGSYVIWKNNPYVAIRNIASGDTLSSSNLDALGHGIVNDLNDTVSNNIRSINNLNTSVNTINNTLNKKTNELELTSSGTNLDSVIHAWMGTHRSNYSVGNVICATGIFSGTMYYGFVCKVTAKVMVGTMFTPNSSAGFRFRDSSDDTSATHVDFTL